MSGDGPDVEAKPPSALSIELFVLSAGADSTIPETVRRKVTEHDGDSAALLQAIKTAVGGIDEA